MKFEMEARVERVVVETFTAVVDEDNEEAAKDLLYDVLSTYPHSPLVVSRLLRVAQDSFEPTSIEITQVNVKKTTEEEVFEDDNA